jgi:hypothetical protein
MITFTSCKNEKIVHKSFKVMVKESDKKIKKLVAVSSMNMVVDK